MWRACELASLLLSMGVCLHPLETCVRRRLHSVLQLIIIGFPNLNGVGLMPTIMIRSQETQALTIRHTHKRWGFVIHLCVLHMHETYSYTNQVKIYIMRSYDHIKMIGRWEIVIYSPVHTTLQTRHWIPTKWDCSLSLHILCTELVKKKTSPQTLTFHKNSNIQI